MGAYALSGQMDSTIKYARKVIELDSTSADPAVMVVNLMKDSLQNAGELIDLIAQRGSAENKENTAILLVNAAFNVLRSPATDSGIADTIRLGRASSMARRAIQLADPAGRAFPNANYAFGLSTVFLISKIDPEAERAKSCDLARREDSLVQEVIPALTAGRSADATRVDQYLGYVNSLKPRTASMIRAYCH